MEKTRRASAYWRQLYWYCIVMTDKGLKAVTEKHGKIIYWRNNGKPLDLGEWQAKDACQRLVVNGVSAFPVCLGWELTGQI